MNGCKMYLACGTSKVTFSRKIKTVAHAHVMTVMLSE
jgi:hypothetical protein